MGLTFRPAEKKQLKLRLAIAGPSGSGKTYTGLALGAALAEHYGAKFAVVDTEHGSAAKYADRFAFDVLELAAPFHPDRYMAAIRDAAGAGYGVILLDSLSHAWNGTGGILEMVDQEAARIKGNSHMAWGKVTPIYNRLIEVITSTPLHLLATMRSKQEYAQEKDERTGRTVVRKLGMAPIQRDGFEYEFDLFTEMDHEHRLVVSKSRCPELADAVMEKPSGAAIADPLVRWLDSGTAAPAPPPPPPAATPPAPPPATETNGHGEDARLLVASSAHQHGVSFPAVVAHLDSAFGGRKVADLAPAEVQELLTWIQGQGVPA